MKKLLLITLLFPCLLSFSQRYGEDEPVGKKNIISLQSSKILRTSTDSINFRLDNVQFCLNRFHSQHKTGMIFIGIGYTTTIVGSLVAIGTTENIDQYRLLMGLGGGLSIIGVIITLDSYKWLKQASISPYPGGINLKITF
jgi:hypothetical protein